MLRTFKERREQEEGFTLIELMVVVLIIAILLAIAIPTFLGARERANNRAAQSSLRNALTAAKVLYTDSQDFNAADTSAEMELVEPSLSYVEGTAVSDNYKEVSIADNSAVDTAVATQWSAAALSKTNTCYFIREVGIGSTAGTYFGSVASDSAGAGCSGSAAGATTVVGANFP